MKTYRLGTVGDRVLTVKKNQVASAWSPSNARTAIANTSSFHPTCKYLF